MGKRQKVASDTIFDFYDVLFDTIVSSIACGVACVCEPQLLSICWALAS